MEANPLFRSADGSFGKRGALLRGGMAAGALAIQYLTIRRPDTPRWVVRTLTAINFVAAGMSAGIAHRNWTIDGRPPEARR